jgi:pimeloyl-ACP methyl ester carboxylesterase
LESAAQPREEVRDYGPMLARWAVPATVLVGESVGTVPRLVGEADRARLAANPNVRLHTVVGVGHDITMGATSIVLGAIRRAAAAG